MSEVAQRPTTSSPTTNAQTASVHHPPAGSTRPFRGKTEVSSFMELFHHTAGRTPTVSPDPRNRPERHSPFYHSDRNRLRPRNGKVGKETQVTEKFNRLLKPRRQSDDRN